MGTLAKLRPNEFHTSFTLPPTPAHSPSCRPTAPETDILDYLNYAVSKPDLSYGSYPDGAVSGRRVFYYTTPVGPNNPASHPLACTYQRVDGGQCDDAGRSADNDFEDWFEIYNLATRPPTAPASISARA